ncbi:zinc ribbon domain-containing protein [Sphingomonas sanguinis]|jgi:site-specific DNA recombinase|uniref:Recombinase zinc beta ribbon domain-containing protein n=1 Tax=Sphingomonas sanguinis TaxID=33051 RepID=A0A7Y7USD6_9SPHN|nr:zinc ribbon domain-containing protein [Sphingomonas sanguinis]MBZ6383921.1 zinc ribbon domain-containing protein [Sphingomonas sanguinis]NNG50653.1 hypothetical protein [Sphingomonas sanguinis]NNG55411.1 hypothetical protein [Sphingomonas sanguinis]NVP33212.1 recombinase zinc beta ribbon domain-containing protein [Sphingomonas sanguinis]
MAAARWGKRSTSPPLAQGNRNRHLLSGLIRCSCCGSNYTISSKDYYRCAGQKERGTCDNRLSVRKGPLEEASLTAIQHHLLTEDHVRLFIAEYEREATRLARIDSHEADTARIRLQQLERELGNLYENLLAGIATLALCQMIDEREAEKARLILRNATVDGGVVSPPLLPTPSVLQAQFEARIAALRSTLEDPAVRGQAASIMSRLIESVTIYPDEPEGPAAEVVASVASLVAYAINENAAREGGVFVL